MMKKLSLFILGVSLVVLAINSKAVCLLFQAKTSAEILAEAQKKVPEPGLPSAPTPTTEIEGYDEKYEIIKVPVVKGFPPRVTMKEHRTLVARIPRTRVVDPDSESVAKWRAEVERLRADYNEELAAEIKTIEVRRAKELREATESWVKIIGGVVGTIASLVTLVVTLRRDRRESAQAGRNTARRRRSR